MAKYIDGFILVVPKKKVAEYKKMARMGAKVWKKYGALDYKECMGEDLYPKIPGGMKHLVFPKLAKAKKNETVWFSYIVYKSKKHRDEVNAKVMKEMDKEMEKYKNKPMPFDMKRFAYGGFDVIVE
jgi:alkaline phosphatase